MNGKTEERRLEAIEQLLHQTPAWDLAATVIRQQEQMAEIKGVRSLLSNLRDEVEAAIEELDDD